MSLAVGGEENLVVLNPCHYCGAIWETCSSSKWIECTKAVVDVYLVPGVEWPGTSNRPASAIADLLENFLFFLQQPFSLEVYFTKSSGKPNDLFFHCLYDTDYGSCVVAVY